MKTRRCKYCKKKNEQFVLVNMKSFCDYDHAAKYGRSLVAKDKKKAHAKRKREFYADDIKTRKPAAKRACHAYIRERDKNETCICCEQPLGDDYHAGHWLESGNNPLVRFDEDNIHGQRLDCNFFKGGDRGDYEKNLRAKIGNVRVDALLDKKGGACKLKGSDYKEIEDYFKAKLKTLTSSQN